MSPKVKADLGSRVSRSDTGLGGGASAVSVPGQTIPPIYQAQLDSSSAPGMHVTSAHCFPSSWRGACGQRKWEAKKPPLLPPCFPLRTCSTRAWIHLPVGCIIPGWRRRTGRGIFALPARVPVKVVRDCLGLSAVPGRGGGEYNFHGSLEGVSALPAGGVNAAPVDTPELSLIQIYGGGGHPSMYPKSVVGRDAASGGFQCYC